MSKYSKKAKRHAQESRQRTRKMMQGAKSRSGPVTISYLPGFEPPPPPEPPKPKTKFPFKAWINGRPVIVHALGQPVEYLDDVWNQADEDHDDKWLTHGLGLGE